MDIQYLTTKEVAKALRVTEATVREYARLKRLPVQRVGRRWLIPASAVSTLAGC